MEPRVTLTATEASSALQTRSLSSRGVEDVEGTAGLLSDAQNTDPSAGRTGGELELCKCG